MMISSNLICQDPQFESQIVGLLNRYFFNITLSPLQGTATQISNLYEIYEDIVVTIIMKLKWQKEKEVVTSLLQFLGGRDMKTIKASLLR